MKNVVLDSSQLPNIILIDDEKMTLYLTQKILLNYHPDFLISTFTSGRDAMIFLANQVSLNKTVVLLDINMPLYNGWDFLNDFSEADTICSVFMFTSSIDKLDMIKSESYNLVKGFISKPLTPQKIEQIITNY
ncbi:MAG: response regulator [bacterium]|nr:response regulator [bacterium]